LRDFGSEADFAPPKGGNYLKSTSQQFVWKCDLNLPNICFRLSIFPNGHRESQQLGF
jgi:hypothetical protein